jgi:hypothetical protein
MLFAWLIALFAAIWIYVRSKVIKKPNVVIGDDHDPYMRRWYLIPKNRHFNIYLHQLLRDDADPWCHDHPWWNLSIVLGVGYIEVTQEATCIGGGGGGSSSLPGRTVTSVNYASIYTYRYFRRVMPRFSIRFRKADDPHRLECLRDKDGKPIPTWSLFITGPVVRQWGYWTDKGWVARRKGGAS